MKDERGVRIYEIRCRECGAMFISTSLNKSYCSNECRARARRRRRGEPEEPEEAIEEQKPQKAVRHKGAGLDADARAARKLGMSYGQYMAKYGGENERRAGKQKRSNEGTE